MRFQTHTGPWPVVDGMMMEELNKKNVSAELFGHPTTKRLAGIIGKGS